MLWTRVASGVVLAPLFLVLVYLEFPYFHLLVAAIAGVMAVEFTRMDGKAGTKRRTLTAAAAVVAVALMSADHAAAAAAVIVAATAAVIAADQVAGRKGFHVVHIAVLYAALPAVSLLYVMAEGGARSIFWLLAVVWATDIGAYAFGRMIGGPKLAPSVSPNKTWSGAVGGLVSAVLISAGLLAWVYGQGLSASLLMLAAGLSVVSQAGDLFESALKRRYQVKDSGAIIPGHGGVMDRFDGLWAAAPLAAVFCLVLGGVQQW
ncbi:MAG: phosphatidate cytidylyltransferase [Rhodospirillaceae bacterium]|nr:phosphatidate cytidylyltransferase [Rhodospirillaceae bacterium]